MSDTALIQDVTEATFEQEVLEASRRQPVVVDFWADWCGPCHQLAPLLERAAAKHAGEVSVRKLDVDAAPGLARRYGVQGIPAVKAFRDGAVVSEFVGVQPATAVDSFFAALAPSPADRLVEKARAATGAERESLLREALSERPDHAGAVIALAELLVERGDHDEARALLARIPGDAQARSLLARLTLADAGDEADLDALRAAADAGDGAARVALGRSLAARGDYDEALPLLIAAVRDPATREDARAAVLDVFAVLGADHELVKTWRPRLASALF